MALLCVCCFFYEIRNLWCCVHDDELTVVASSSIILLTSTGKIKACLTARIRCAFTPKAMANILYPNFQNWEILAVVNDKILNDLFRCRRNVQVFVAEFAYSLSLRSCRFARCDSIAKFIHRGSLIILAVCCCAPRVRVTSTEITTFRLER